MKDAKDFIEYSNNMLDIYKNFEEYNPIRKIDVLTVCDDVIADVISNKKLSPIIRWTIYYCLFFIYIIKKYIIILLFPSTKRCLTKFTYIFSHKKPSINRSFNKFHLTFHQILTWRALLIFAKIKLENHIFFKLLILLLHQIMLYVLERVV